MKKLILIVVLVLVAAAFLPVRPAMRAPEVTRLSLAADDKKSASLVRILNSDAAALNAVSVYCYGLAADRLAAKERGKHWNISPAWTVTKSNGTLTAKNTSPHWESSPTPSLP